MDHSQEHKETDPESLAGDTRTLVTALTELLRDDQPPRITQQPLQTAPMMHTTSTTTPDAILRNITSTSSSNDGDERQSPLLPAFLADSQVRAALQRADSLRPQGHLSDEPYFPSSLMSVPPHYQDGREQAEDNQPRDFHPSMGLFAYPDSSYAPRSPVPLHSQGLDPEHVGVSAKFEPGKETASVLQITRRPRLRPKDVSHRQSLGGNGQGPSPAKAGYGSPLSTTPPFGISTSPSGTPAPRHFMVILVFGQRRVSVPGYLSMPVAELRRMAGAIAGLDPMTLFLVNGETVLHAGANLGDYSALIGFSGFIVSVTLAGNGFRIVGQQPYRQIVLENPSSLTEPPGDQVPPPVPSPLLVAGNVPGESSYTILVIFEVGPPMQCLGVHGSATAVRADCYFLWCVC